MRGQHGSLATKEQERRHWAQMMEKLHRRKTRQKIMARSRNVKMETQQRHSMGATWPHQQEGEIASAAGFWTDQGQRRRKPVTGNARDNQDIASSLPLCA